MKQFYGTKKLAASPMTRAEYNAYRGWSVPGDENGEDLGHLVEYMDGGKPNDPRHDGYISWSPKEQFDSAYQPIDAMSFGHALVAMKAGHKVARAGWNGKGVWVALTPSEYIDVMSPRNVPPKTAVEHRVDEMRDGDGNVTQNAHMSIKQVDGSVSVWVPSVGDCLADDWRIVT